MRGVLGLWGDDVLGAAVGRYHVFGKVGLGRADVRGVSS